MDEIEVIMNKLSLQSENTLALYRNHCLNGEIDTAIEDNVNIDEIHNNIENIVKTTIKTWKASD